MPASYGPLDESVRLAAVRRRAIHKLKDQGSFQLASARRVGESWYMDWTRNFPTGLGKNNYGLDFVESKAWLLRVRYFPEESATRLLCNLNLHYGWLSLKLWEGMLFAAEGQFDLYPMPHSKKGLPTSTNPNDPDLRSISRHEAYFGWRPGASALVARPGQSVYFMVPGRKMTSGHHMPDAGIFVRPCAESRGWVIRCLRTRKLVFSRNVYVVKDPNSRHAQLALSDDLVGRHGSLDTSPDTYRAGVRALFAAHLLEPPAAPLIVDETLTGVPIALVPALDADRDHVLVPESAWA